MPTQLIRPLYFKNQKLAESGNQNQVNSTREYLGNEKDVRYQGTASGGIVEVARERKTKSAKQIINELYERYNQDERSSKDKKHIKKLLDWH